MYTQVFIFTIIATQFTYREHIMNIYCTLEVGLTKRQSLLPSTNIIQDDFLLQPPNNLKFQRTN